MKRPNSLLRSLLTGIALTVAVVDANAAGGNDPIRASVQASASASLALSTTLASVPVFALYAGSTLTVASIQLVGDAAALVLKGAADGAQAVVSISGETLRALGIAAGQSVAVVAHESGYLLVAAGRVLGFVAGPSNAALLHSSRTAQ